MRKKRICMGLAALLLLSGLSGCTAEQAAQFAQLQEQIQQAQEALENFENAVPEETQAPAVTPTPAPAQAPEATAPAPEETPAPVPPEETQAPAAPEETQAPEAAREARFAAILETYAALCRIPREDPGAISQYLYAWAIRHDLIATRDAAGNVIVEKAATAGCEAVPTVLLHADMDMPVSRQFGSLMMTQVLLHEDMPAASDGAVALSAASPGMAFALYALQADDLTHGPLRAIFTNRMAGAATLDARHLDAKYLISLDGGAYGTVYTGAPAARVYRCAFTPAWTAPAGTLAYEISLAVSDGTLPGRTDAVRALALLLQQLWNDQSVHAPALAAFGGDAANAAAVVVITDADAKALEAALAAYAGLADVRYAPLDTPDKTLYAPLAQDLLDMLCLLPSLPAGSDGTPGQALRTLSMADELYFELYESGMTPAQAALREILLGRLAARVGCTMELTAQSPAWQAQPDALARMSAELYEETTGEALQLAQAAMSPCGWFTEKNPELECICMGAALQPQDERFLNAVACAELLTGLLADIADE